MSVVRMSPELIATLQTGEVASVVSGGAPLGARVRGAWLEPPGVEGSPWTVCVDVLDGIDGDRLIVMERHVCALPSGIQEALNSGDGTYHP